MFKNVLGISCHIKELFFLLSHQAAVNQLWQNRGYSFYRWAALKQHIYYSNPFEYVIVLIFWLSAGTECLWSWSHKYILYSIEQRRYMYTHTYTYLYIMIPQSILIYLKQNFCCAEIILLLSHRQRILLSTCKPSFRPPACLSLLRKQPFFFSFFFKVTFWE